MEVAQEMTRDDVMRETLKHVRRVGDLLAMCIGELTRRAIHHDDSKFSEQEFPAFAEATPQLKGLTYGSEEYKAELRTIKPAIEHHYKHNSHHPEYFARFECSSCLQRHTEEQLTGCGKCGCNVYEVTTAGVDGMDLLDVLEMLCDWKAAGERHADGSLEKSFDVNRSRFGISPQLETIMRNTATRLGWI